MKNIFRICLFSILIHTVLFAQETKIELPTNNIQSSFLVTGTDADRRMKFFADGGFYLTGDNDAGTIPISGAGGRLMWFPGRRAFRVGAVDGAYWDLENIGRYSIATGVNTTASGECSSAMGCETIASEEWSSAMGYQTIASGYASTAMGRSTTASGTFSTAMGCETIARGFASTVVGKYNAADVSAIFIVGGGDNASQRKNLFQIDLNGYAWFNQSVRITGNSHLEVGDDVNIGGDIKADGSAEIYGNVWVGGDLIANDLWTLFDGGGTEYRLYPSAGLVRYQIDTFSDRRLKENVATISSPLQKIQQLRGVTFNWNSTAKDVFINELKENVRANQNLPEAEQEKVMQEKVDKKLEELSQTEISFIAQEVEAVFPEWVNEDENGYKKIDMKGLNGLLVEAVKEQQTMIEKLEKQNEMLTTRITKLEEMFAAQMVGK